MKIKTGKEKTLVSVVIVNGIISHALNVPDDIEFLLVDIDKHAERPLITEHIDNSSDEATSVNPHDWLDFDPEEERRYFYED